MSADLRIDAEHVIAPGEIWSVTGTDPQAVGEWCARLARRDDLEDLTALVNFAQQADTQQKSGWPQARYYAEDGATVSEFLSYNAVWDVNPFEVGARRPETRASFRKRIPGIMRLLDLVVLADRPLMALSNGETRRVLLARALARGPKLLILDDPAAGLDARRRCRLREIASALARRGTAVIWASRHEDELPDGVSKRFEVMEECGGFKVSESCGARRTDAVPRPDKDACVEARRHGTARGSMPSEAPAVVEIRSLSMKFGRRVLFRDFSWTVRRGERWMLRGENGSGKTTLLALITGDSPLAYAADVRVFGQRRKVGAELSRIRRRIGSVSPELQACLGESPESLLDAALARRPDLLLLDEPFMNMSAEASRVAKRRISEYLDSHPGATAILVSHRTDEAPDGFNLVLDL